MNNLIHKATNTSTYVVLMLSYFSDDRRRCNFGGADFGYSPDYKYQKNCIQGGVNVNLHGLTGSPREGDMPWQHFPTYRTFGNESWKFPGRGSETWQKKLAS